MFNRSSVVQYIPLHICSVQLHLRFYLLSDSPNVLKYFVFFLTMV